MIEVAFPQIHRLAPGETQAPFHASEDHVGIDECNLVNEHLTSHHHWNRAGKCEYFASQHRYAWPAEYDLMAHLARVRLSERWSDWRAIHAASTSHVSVWEKPADL